MADSSEGSGATGYALNAGAAIADVDSGRELVMIVGSVVLVVSLIDGRAWVWFNGVGRVVFSPEAGTSEHLENSAAQNAWFLSPPSSPLRHLLNFSWQVKTVLLRGVGRVAFKERLVPFEGRVRLVGVRTGVVWFKAIGRVRFAGEVMLESGIDEFNERFVPFVKGKVLFNTTVLLLMIVAVPF